MVRGEAILFILTVFIQLNTGSVFDQFSAPEKKDKNKMLMYLRGLLKLDTPTTTPSKGLTTVAPKFEQIIDAKSLPDRTDKSKMLAYLRGMKAPNNMYSVYQEPQHKGLIQTLQSADVKNTAQNAQNNQNTGIDPSNKNTQALWANQATQMTILQPAEQEIESDTCFWRGQQTNAAEQKSQLVQSVETTTRRSRRRTRPPKPTNMTSFTFENMGENVIAFWECMKTKFWKSYDKLQTKLCTIF